MVNEIRTKMVAAMKAGNKEDERVYKNILAALIKKQKDVARDPLTKQDTDDVFMKMVKELENSLAEAPADRTEFIEKTTYELNIVKGYAPVLMGEAEIKTEIEAVLADLALDKPTVKDKGKIMKNLAPQVKGKADMGIVNQTLQGYFV